MLISVVIPCFQNEKQLSKTVFSVLSELRSLESDFEVILVDDASTDKTWKIIQELSFNNQEINGLKLARNVGAYNAITYGLIQSQGDAVIIMAADGDDPPNLISRLIKNFNNVDAVLATRNLEQAGFIGSVLSQTFWTTLKFIGAKNITHGGSDFLLVSRGILNSAILEGWKSGNTIVQLIQHAKTTGSMTYQKGKNQPSSWTFSKKLKLFLQTVNQFVPIPGVRAKPPQTHVANRC